MFLQATPSKVANNDEIVNLKKILGLQQGIEYDEKKWTLRYGRIMIMTDADVDGSHIKGLLLNLFHTFWPSLIKIPRFYGIFYNSNCESN